MKKTFTINLSGLIFHIDEDAYELLQAYLEKLKEHFAGIEGQEDIVADIESRMAELLQERLGSEKQVVSISDAKYVIDQLGQPFEMDDESNTTDTAGQTYRRTSRRLFRDPDHSKIAGVASGLAAWLGIDVVWVRLIFILAFFASGSGLLIYIALWIVLPEALTHAEKLEMRGDPVNISNIEKSVRKEMNEVSERLGKAAKQASDSISRQVPKSRNFFDQVFAAIGQIFSALFKIFGVFLGIVLIFGGLSLITTLIAGFIGYESVGWLIESEEFRISPLLIGDLIFGSESVASLASLSISLILFIPLILLVYAGLKLVSAGRFSIGSFTLVSFTTWVVSWFVLLGLGISTAMNFR
ncbi:MAG: PspC domain-containing protein [Bacteroidales bacterium]|nr:PspC domain-containing protein [Bacteroidales bacterium]